MPVHLFGKKCVSAVWILIALGVGLTMTARAFAQVSGATLSGTVKDSSGAFIPSAKLAITNVATGVTRTIAADAAGLYAAPNLLPGTYEIRVSATGFSTEVQKGIALTVGA